MTATAWQWAALLLSLLLLGEQACAWMNYNSYTATGRKRTDLRRRCPNVSTVVQEQVTGVININNDK